MGKEWYHKLSLAEFSGFIAEFLGISSGEDVVSLREFFSKFRCVEYGAGEDLKAYVRTEDADTVVAAASVTSAGSDDERKGDE